MKNINLLKKINKLQYDNYISSCWVDFAQTYIKATDNENLNKLELILEQIQNQNNSIKNQLENLWKNKIKSINH